MNTKVSAVIITYNEATNLVRTLSQLYWCDEIIIVDSYSTDETIAICLQYGCKIFYRSFETYVEQKCYGIGKAANDWILCIDADEYITERLVDELQDELKNTGNNKGYRMPVNRVFRGQELKYGKEQGNYLIRLFSRKWSIANKNKTHEYFEIIGPVKKLKNKIQHFSYRDIQQYIVKMNRTASLNSGIAANKAKDKKGTFIFIALPGYFLKKYFLDRNFLNGTNGFYWSVVSAFSSYPRYYIKR